VKLDNLDVAIKPEDIRTPTLDIEQVESLKDMMPDGSHTPSSIYSTTDSDEENASPVWSSRRGSASSQSSAIDTPDFEKEAFIEKDDEEENTTLYMSQSTPQLHDVGGLLPARKGILVHRSFSVERFRVPSEGTGGNVIPPNVSAVQKQRDSAFTAAKGKLKRKSVRYREEVDMISILQSGPVAKAAA
jgi:hypothetical protein